MTLNDYQLQAKQTDRCPRVNGDGELNMTAASLPLYQALGLGGEAGEVLEEIKKLWRRREEPTDEDKLRVALELGDVLWYLSNLASFMGFSLQTIAQLNIEKLERKYAGSARSVYGG